MAAPVIGKRPQYVPPIGARVDWSHPLAAGLEFCFIPALGMTDLARGYAATRFGSPSVGNTKYGQGGRILASSGDYYDFAGVPDAPFAGPITIAWVGRQLSAADWRNLTSKLNGATYTNYPFDLYFANTTPPSSLIWYRANAGSRGWASTNTFANNTDYVLVGTQPATIETAPVLWINGSQQTMTASAGAGTGAAGGSGGSVRVGRRQDGSVVQADEHLNLLAIWSRQFSAADANALYADPFCFLKS